MAKKAKKTTIEAVHAARRAASQGPATKSRPPRYTPPDGGPAVERDPEPETKESGDAD